MGIELDMIWLEEMLAGLKDSASLAPYNLTLYRRHGGEVAGAAPFRCCCSRIQDPLKNELARRFFVKELDLRFSAGTPAVCRYGGAFFGFLVPFSRSGYDFCLVGDGVRDTSIDLWQLAALSQLGGAELFSLFSHMESLCIATVQEVEIALREVVGEIDRIPPSPPPVSEITVADQTDTRLAEVAGFLEQLDRSRTITETVAVCWETIGALIGFPRTAIALRQASGTSYAVSGIWGLPDDLGTLSAQAIGCFLSRDKVKKAVLFDAQMRGALPALQATLTTCFPLEYQADRLGFIALIDTDLTASDLLLVSMLTRGVASRMAQILKEAEQARSSSLSGRLMSLTHTLLHVESKEELYSTVLEIAADLLDASQGSIMLIDKDGETMHIVFTKGMTLHVAQCLPMKVGKGIAGKVAQTGLPLLVNDVEKDSRVAMTNRPRFKSKALICIPLKLKEKIIGVVCLSDKANLAPFTDADLELLTSCANLASLMIERTLVLEESDRFEQLSVTDSLTGLYNRRFLKGRTEEELNRSSRQELELTILFIDLDFFKNYNDVCGHIAGDGALKKTAQIIQGSLREMDIVARYGGEEFCVLLPGTSKTEALVVAERIRYEIENEKFPCAVTSSLGKLTASFGVASYPEDGRTFTALLHASDIALYQAKAGGRNRIVAAQPPPARLPSPIMQPPPTPPVMQPQPAPPVSRTFDFKSYLEATESKRHNG